MLVMPDATTMISNFVAAVPNLMRLVTACAYVLGMISIMKCVMEFKHYGETRSMYSREHGMTAPLIYLFTGTALLYLPSAVQVSMSTFWSDPNPYGYLQQVGEWNNFIADCISIIQLVGTIAFIKGLITLNHMGSGSTSKEAFGKGIRHLIGGIFCINIYQFVQVILFTLGIQFS